MAPKISGNSPSPALMPVHNNSSATEPVVQKKKSCSYPFVIVFLNMLVQDVYFAIRQRTKVQDKKLEDKYDRITKDSYVKQLYSGNRSWQVTAGFCGAKFLGMASGVPEWLAGHIRTTTANYAPTLLYLGPLASLGKDGATKILVCAGSVGDVAGPHAQMLASFFTAEPTAQVQKYQSELTQLNTQMQSNSANQDTSLKDIGNQIMNSGFEAFGRVGR